MKKKAKKKSNGKVTVDIGSELHERLSAHKAKTGKTKTFVICELLTKYLDEMED